MSGHGWTTIVSSSPKRHTKGKKQGKLKTAQKIAPASPTSSAHQKASVHPPKLKATEADLLQRVVSLFDRFLNTSNDEIVASYHIDGRCVNLYGLRESMDDMDRIEVNLSLCSDDEILFHSKKERKHVYDGHLYRPRTSICFHTYDPKSGKVSFYNDSSWENPAIRFNSNLRHWLDTYEVVLYNAQEVYMQLVGQYSHSHGVDAGSNSISTIPASAPPFVELPIWPSATPEDLLGRLQWYMDQFVSPDNRQVVVNATKLCCWRSNDCNKDDHQLLPSHLVKSPEGLHTIVQRSRPTSVYHYKSEMILENAVVEYRHNFKNIGPGGLFQYWRDQLVNGQVNYSVDDFEPSKYAKPVNLYRILSSPDHIVALIESR